MAHIVPKEVSAKLVLIRDGKVLIRTFVDPKTGAKIYDLPGGRIDVGEQPEQAAKREAMEELGATVSNLKLIHTEFVGKPDNLTLGIFFSSDNFEIAGSPQLGKDLIEGEVVAIDTASAVELLTFDVCKRVVRMALPKEQ